VKKFVLAKESVNYWYLLPPNKAFSLVIVAFGSSSMMNLLLGLYFEY
jgi:hypothetical protein